LKNVDVEKLNSDVKLKKLFVFVINIFQNFENVATLWSQV